MIARKFLIVFSRRQLAEACGQPLHARIVCLTMPRLAEKIGQWCIPSIVTLSDFLPVELGSLLFCPDCGTLLDLPKDAENEVKCQQCGHLEPASCELSQILSLDGGHVDNTGVQHMKTSRSLLVPIQTPSLPPCDKRERRRRRYTKERMRY